MRPREEGFYYEGAVGEGEGGKIWIRKRFGWMGAWTSRGRTSPSEMKKILFLFFEGSGIVKKLELPREKVVHLFWQRGVKS